MSPFSWDRERELDEVPNRERHEDLSPVERHDAWCGCLSRTDRFGNVEPCAIARDYFDNEEAA